MSNCEWCRFAPHFLYCPNCKEDFDLSLIMFNYGSDRPSYQSDKRKHRPDVYRYRLGDLKNSMLCEPEKNAVEFLTEEYFELLANYEFDFSDSVRCFIVHTIFVSPDNRLWLHLWLYKSPSPDENELRFPLGQLTMVYPSGSEKTERDYKKINCMVKESF